MPNSKSRSDSGFITILRQVILVVSFVSSYAIHANAQSTWIGGNSNWNVESNWSPFGVPNHVTDVWIDNDPSSQSVVILNDHGNARNLTIDAGDGLQISGSSGSLHLTGNLLNNGSFQVSDHASFGSQRAINNGTVNVGFANVRMDELLGNGEILLSHPDGVFQTQVSDNFIRGHGILSVGANNHIIRAEGGLLRTYGAIQNSNGLIQVSGESRLWTWNTEPVVGGVVAFEPGSSITGHYENIELLGNPRVVGEIIVENGLHNQGSISLKRTTQNFEQIIFRNISSSGIGFVNLTGGGDIVMTSTDFPRTSSITIEGHHLTDYSVLVNHDNLIRGYGEIFNADRIINHHIIRAEGGILNFWAGFPNLINYSLGTLELGAGGGFAFNGSFNVGGMSGSGKIFGDYVNTGRLSPGNSAGTIDIVQISETSGGNFVWDSSGLMIWDLGDGALNSDLLRIENEFSLSGSGEWAFTFVDNGWQIGQTYTLIEFGSTSLLDASLFSWTNGSGFYGEFALTGNSLQFTLQSVPEPSSGLLLLTVGMVVMFTRRRQS